MRWAYRFNLTMRLLAILSGIAGISTGLALLLQERALSRDLQGAAVLRIERAADATALLVDGHLQALQERYRAISGTPQFRATLEVDDGATLQFFAESLAAKARSAQIAFLDPDGRVIAAAGSLEFSSAASGLEVARLLTLGDEAFTAAVIPLQTRNELMGHLIAFERIDEDLLSRWSKLCGADVSFSARGEPSPDVLTRVVQRFPGLDLQVAISLDAEREALAHARENLLTAGGVALLVAFIASMIASRGVVRPILELQHATEKIGAGDFSTPLASRRRDELGDVARAFDGMLERLATYRSQVESHRGELESNVTELQTSREQLAKAQRLAHVGSWTLDLSTGALSGSEEFMAILGFEGADPEKIIFVRDALDLIHSDDRAGIESAFVDCISDAATLRLDCRLALEGAPERVLHVQAKTLVDEDQRCVGLEGVVQDITERKRSEEQIRFLAYHDGLTGLGNRLLCRERLSLEIQQARRDNQNFGIIYLDLDHFKRINDTLGHSLGDELLKGVADRLVSSVRDSDFRGRPMKPRAVSRMGGDEFSVMLPDVKDVQDLALVSRRIMAALARPFELGGHDVVIGGSIGIATFPSDGEDAETLLKNADAAMYHAKQQGRGNYQFYAESMNEVAMRRLILESKMRQALEHGEFELHYQPKVDSQTRDLVAVEALVRWRDPEAGLMSPGVFIPIAEETGLIIPLGDWIVQEACRQIAVWRTMGRDVPVSVNLSTQQFRKEGLAARILEIIACVGIEPRMLEIEITESTLMHDETAVIRELEILHAAGLLISVDDFGTGYSSFAYLRKLPVDALKIDRSFVMEIEGDRNDAALAASIVSMGHALGLRVIAEGVETEGQATLLAEWRCDELQGFLHGRPGLPAEIEKWFSSEVEV